MDDYEPFASLALAGAAGLLIGLERERSAAARQRETGSFLGGARTHPLFALLGGVSTLLSRELGLWIVALALGALVVLMAIAYADDVRRGADRGITSEAAFLMSFLLGALSLSQGVVEPAARKVFVVASLAVVATLLLSAKPAISPVVARLSPEDVTATLKFLIVAVVVLPLLPDRALGPFEVLNPASIGKLVTLIAGISFVGYAAIRLLGPERGLAITGVVGGLASSTAVTLSMASRAREEPRLAAPCALAVVLASTIMFARVLVVAAVVNRDLVAPLVFPMAGAALGGCAAALVLYGRSRDAVSRAGPIAVSNPFELSAAIKFAFLFAVVLLGSRAATAWLGTGGTYLAGVLAGAADVDAITLSMARLAGGSVSRGVAATTIFLGVISNTLVKAVMAAAVGGRPLGRAALPGFAAMLLGGTAGAVVAGAVGAR